MLSTCYASASFMSSLFCIFESISSHWYELPISKMQNLLSQWLDPMSCVTLRTDWRNLLTVASDYLYHWMDCWVCCAACV
ncbi:hypothetical protein PILCRDRAFT_661668 [Piloderma croceum F 1598]|uniref:Uncharacterized protein n=1 Tax=Piloderma croceum (strain F 1598) TaxID=765440 RepID=A0A0C3APZ0_PILCF|nr:hypothetical protein PILCRDRAFT_661668 [Piloderma croceum F 1598]